MKKIIFFILFYSSISYPMLRIPAFVTDVNAWREEATRNLKLSTACELNNTEMARQALKAGASPNRAYLNKRPCLHYVAQHGSVELLILLLKYGASIERPDMEGNTPIHFASHKNSLFLIESGAKINARNHKGETPLHQCVKEGKVQFVHDLIRLGADLNLADNLGYTPLITAIEYQNYLICTLLICAGADLYHRNIFGEYSKQLALQTGFLHEDEDWSSDDEEDQKKAKNIITLLDKTDRKSKNQFDNMKKVDELNEYLFKAIKRRNYSASRALIEAGALADARTRKKNSNTPLMIAIKQEDVDIVQMLINAGADVNSRTFKKKTPLWIATAKLKDSSIIKLLLDAGAGIFHVIKGTTILHNTAQQKNEAGCKLILERQAKITNGLMLGLLFLKKNYAVLYQNRMDLLVPHFDNYYQDRSLQKLLNAQNQEGKRPYDLGNPEWEWLKPAEYKEKYHDGSNSNSL